MVTLKDVKTEIANALAQEKAYGLPNLCKEYGLADGDESEAFQSKRSYVMKRLAGKDKNSILILSRKVMEEYPTSELAKILEKYYADGGFSITSITREKILSQINQMGNLEGKMEIIDFLNRVFDIKSRPSEERDFETFEYDAIRHMRANWDWDYMYLLNNKMNFLHVSDKEFIYFLEQIVHPIVRLKDEQEKYVDIINSYLEKDGYKLVNDDVISGEVIYKVRSIKNNGVKGRFKNLIFASDGPKPEIAIIDSLNNEIKILKNEEHCLVYSNKIGKQGLRWGDLIEWWKGLNNIQGDELNIEQELYKRLEKTLCNGPEKKFFFLYYKNYKKIFERDLPVLIPQVYLHYDPFTIKQLGGKKRLVHQRMDFLILFSDKDRVVIEIDGKQHYSDDNISSPKKYSEMIASDRQLTLSGYKIFRFGGYEFMQNNVDNIIKNFFEDLFSFYGFNLKSPMND